MSRPKPPFPAKLVIGVFTQDKELLPPVLDRLVEKYGDIDLISRWMPFDFTDYYEPEMGKNLFRRMVAFKQPIAQDHLPAIKLFTNAIEAQFIQDNRRHINIDPGYLLQERFVLATGKNFSHRIYIGNGIYADLTLIYQKGEFQSLPWTFPDYREKSMHRFLRRVRDKYIIDIKQSGFQT